MLAVTAPLLAGCNEPNSATAAVQASEPDVSVVTVKEQARAMVRELPGRIAPTRVSEVRPRVSGIVVNRMFHQGSEVKVGDPLYQIDPRPFEVELQSTEAALARASGISTPLIYGATFAFGAALAGLAGALIVPVFSLFADLGIRFLIQGFVAVMVGGVGSFIGPVAGAGLIGTLSAALPWVMSPVVADVLVFVLAIAFIKFRPQGLIAGKGV